ncbi:hypothetical protein RB195_025535 [Necator americanus]|uniref:Reverse transcriptase domain-containing protein n=1 Tax=Necator americanus TaxID=51031 RepID=A0ABR1ESR6_NECAM
MRRRLRRQLKCDRENGWTSRAKKFEGGQEAEKSLYSAKALAFLDFEATFDSPYRGRLLNALCADGVPGEFVRLIKDMNRRITAAVRTPAGCTTPIEVETGVRQGVVAGPFLFNFAVDGITRRTVE